MANSFTTSVNILRDTGKDLNYIPTPNSKQVVNQIVNDFKKGIRSFNIIGTYGTGKSSFLLAFEQSVSGIQNYFETNLLPAQSKVEFIKFVGSYSSIIEQFADEFDVKTTKNQHENILSEIFNRYHAIGKRNSIMFLLIDEFGKYLEYASKHNPEDALYFIQQLAEFCNNSRYNIVLITTVHQSFDSYAYTLTSTQKQEWTKVKGRFREITFNEPVEQLLYLASEFISNDLNRKFDRSKIQECLNIILSSKSFNFNVDFIKRVAENLFPLDVLSATILTYALQRYGQNERSLFSFLESTDETGIAKYKSDENPFYNLSCVYDYLNYNFYSFLTSKYNPDFSSWSTMRASIEKAERTFDDSFDDYIKTIKTIGLINIFTPIGASLDFEFLCDYLRTACGIVKSNQIVSNLEAKKIIRFRQHSKRYILFEGTDLDIQSALIEAGNKIPEVSDITSLLNQYFQFKPEIAKLYSYETGTPRFFQFILTEYLIDSPPEGEIDGYVNLVFSNKLKLWQVEEVSRRQKEAIVYCYYKNVVEIKALLFEIEKIRKVIDENKDDKIAKRELENISDSQKRLLNHYIIESIFSGSKDIRWFFGGEEKKVTSKREFNKLLSDVCFSVYDSTPSFKNELVNKHKVSASVNTAKRNFIKALINDIDKNDLGFEYSKYPPEKTIYMTLIRENGIKLKREDVVDNQWLDRKSSFYKLWRICQKFIESTKQNPRKVSDLMEILSKRPFKLKQGLIDLWVPTFLYLKRDDYALFNDGGYIPLLSEENLELISKYPERYRLKAFDVEGVKLDIFKSYRRLLNQSAELNFDNTSFIETIKPFIVFFRQLPEYSKNTQRLSQVALKLRHAIISSKDPENTFFDAFPAALGFSLSELLNDKKILNDYTKSLQSAIHELRTSYIELIKRFEDYICNEYFSENVSFKEYKTRLQSRFTSLKKHLLLPQQKSFILRLDSELDDKAAWLNSLAQALTGKTLENFTDNDEMILYERFRSMIVDLDSLAGLSMVEIDENKEEIIRVKIDTFFDSINPRVVRIPKGKKEHIDLIKSRLMSNLGPDKTSNIAAVLNLLKEIL
jgi:hypothetical protein